SSSSVRRVISDSTLPLPCQRVSVRLGSASTRATLRPALCQYTARQAIVVDLPAPPLAVAATRTLAAEAGAFRSAIFYADRRFRPPQEGRPILTCYSGSPIGQDQKNAVSEASPEDIQR